MEDNVNVTSEGSEKMTVIEFTLSLDVKDSKVESCISFKQLKGVSVENMQLVGRKILAFKKSVENLFITDKVGDGTSEIESENERENANEPAPETETPAEE